MTNLDWSLRACRVYVQVLALYHPCGPPRGDPRARALDRERRRASPRTVRGPMHVPRVGPDPRAHDPTARAGP